MGPDELKKRCQVFAVSVIRMTRNFPRTVDAFEIGKQIIRSAGSVGANYRSSRRARSHAEFISKLKVSEEEADETIYWLEIIRDVELANINVVEPLLKEANELTAIFTSSGKTAKENELKNKKQKQT